MDKIIIIDGKEIGFRATALTPRLYRHTFGRDMVQDMNQLIKAFNKANSLPKNATEEEKNESMLSYLDLEIFENVAFVMARQYDNTIPKTSEEWLDGFTMFSIFEILPEILTIWGLNNQTTAKSKNA